MNSNGICSRKNFISLDLFCVNYTNIWLMSMLLTCFKLKITEQCFQLVQNVVLVFVLPKLLCNFSAEVSIQCNVESRIRTEYGDFLCKSPYSVQMRENMDQKNSEYGHFLHSDRSEEFCITEHHAMALSLIWCLYKNVLQCLVMSEYSTMIWMNEWWRRT